MMCVICGIVTWLQMLTPRLEVRILFGLRETGSNTLAITLSQ